MIGGTIRTNLSIEAILNKISEFDIIMHYMPTKNWKLNQVTHSPFRNDKNPSFLIGNKLGYLYYVDYADNYYRGGAFDFVKQLFGYSELKDAMIRIDKDFGLGIHHTDASNVGDYKQIVSGYKKPEGLMKYYSFIQVKPRAFNSDELKYWNEYHQSEDDLKRERIYAIDKLYFNRKRFPIKPSELAFAYYYEGGHWKIYRPFESKNRKWLPNNVPITAIDGKSNIKDCDTALILKSRKDYMVVKKLFDTSCAVQNEGVACFSVENVAYIKENSKRQILSFDSDEAGVKASKQITEMFDFDYFNPPRLYLNEGINDWAALARAKGMQTVENLFKQKQLI